jgi:transposase
MEISTIGLDLAKNAFQVHGIDSGGNVVVRRALRRKDVLPFFGRLAPCLVGIEACGSSHHWAREIASCGHDVRLMPPAYVTDHGQAKHGPRCGGSPPGGADTVLVRRVSRRVYSLFSRM